MSSSTTSICPHTHLITSSYPSQSQFSRPSPQHRAAAATPSGVLKPSVTDSVLHGLSDNTFVSTFPGPLVLPGDDLELDPKYPPQSLRSWTRSRDRNKVGEDGKKVIYVVGPPRVEDGGEMGFMKGWTECHVGRSKERGKGKEEVGDWVGDVVTYLEAFYHGLPVKLMSPSLLHFTPWGTSPSQSTKTKTHRKPKIQDPSNASTLGLRTSKEIIAIKFRPTPGSPYTHQLNLDVAISMLPEDAYALLMLVDHDLYEDEDDEFVCGRAYGGSRVAVVSRARYNPVLDVVQGVTRVHAWPASACEAYGVEVCGGKGKGKRMVEGIGGGKDGDAIFAVEDSPLRLAVTAHSSLPSLSFSPNPKTLSGLWLGRICRTASHELGHCFGIDHCVYYACCMQGSASIPEDARQPPYLCPVDLEKVLRATGGDVVERYKALVEVCGKWEDVHMFKAWGRWIEGRLNQIESRRNKE